MNWKSSNVTGMSCKSAAMDWLYFVVKKRIVKKKSEYSQLLKKGRIHSRCITVRNVVVARLCFSQASVFLFTGKGVHGRGRAWQGDAWQGACMCGRGACVGACLAGETAASVEGIHSTGMHSC